MNDVPQLWHPLIGQLVWSVRRGVGAFITMELGEPHLSIREPVVRRLEHSVRVQRSLSRRRVFIVGDWHFWIQYSDWKLTTTGGVVGSESPVGSPLDECLNDLEGQRLRAVRPGRVAASWLFEFDLDGVLEIRPSTGRDEPQWSLHRWNGDIAELRRDGLTTFDKDAYATTSASNESSTDSR
jgi:hypothetical protein